MRREPTTSTSAPCAAATACSRVRKREIGATNRARACRSTLSARPKLWITFARPEAGALRGVLLI
jgi:hypothetical protein